jgi:hypothetical protein
MQRLRGGGDSVRSQRLRNCKALWSSLRHDPGGTPDGFVRWEPSARADGGKSRSAGARRVPSGYTMRLSRGDSKAESRPLVVGPAPAPWWGVVAWALTCVRSYCADRNPDTPAMLAAIRVRPTPASASRRILGISRRWSIANEVSFPASNSNPMAPTTISAPGTSFMRPKVATPRRSRRGLLRC